MEDNINSLDEEALAVSDLEDNINSLDEEALAVSDLEKSVKLGSMSSDEQKESNGESLNTIEGADVNSDSMKIEARERESRLREISQQLRTPSGLTDLEDVPAYQRNNIQLEESNHSAEDEISTYTLNEGDKNKTIITRNNSFLHDNVD